MLPLMTCGGKGKIWKRFVFNTLELRAYW
jgi:hypothetical protein